MLRISSLAPAVALTLCFTAFGNDDVDHAGVLAGGPFQGIDYLATPSGLKGTTRSDGAFQFRKGDTVTFSIGQLTLGKAPGEALITPVNLMPGAKTLGDPRVVQLLQVLQTLDADLKPANGVVIDPALAGAFTQPIDLAKTKNAQTQIIDVAFPAGRARTLVDGNTALLTHATAITSLQDNPVDNELAKGIMTQMGTVAQVLIGGGIHTCDSYQGDGSADPTVNCTESWANILLKDPSFQGIATEDVSFASSYPQPKLTYTLTSERLAAFGALPGSVIQASKRDALVDMLKARQAAGMVAHSEWGLFDGGNPLFVDGNSLWGSDFSDADFETFNKAFCGSPAPANGAVAVLGPANFASYSAAKVESEENRKKALVVLHRILKDLPSAATAGIIYRRDAQGADGSPNLRAVFRGFTKTSALAADGTTWMAGMTNGLSTLEVTALRTLFVDELPGYARKREVRSLPFASDPNTKAILEAFVAEARKLAGGTTPNIGFVTAATENPMGDVDLNASGLKSAGANPVWIPLDAGVRQVLDGGMAPSYLPIFYTTWANTATDGSYINPEMVWPDHAATLAWLGSNQGVELDKAIKSLHGLIFLGGDQARHLAAFTSANKDTGRYDVISRQLTLLRAKADANELVVAGTSAGAAVMAGGAFNGRPTAMIADGESEVVLRTGYATGDGPISQSKSDAMTIGLFYPEGGLGFFKYGIIDTHFSRRAREGRLIRLTKFAQVPFGFGVDENTALMVGKPDAKGNVTMTPLGAGGVFIVDNRKSMSTDSPFTIKGVNVHYLLPGDKMDIAKNGAIKVSLSSNRLVLPANPSAAAPTLANIQRNGSYNFRNLTILMGLTGATRAAGGTNLSQNPNFTFTLTRNAGTEFRAVNGRVAFTNLQVAIQ